MFLFSSSRHGVAAKELQRELDISHKTCWRVTRLIHEHMAHVYGEWPLGGPGGEIMAAETYVGGKTPS